MISARPITMNGMPKIGTINASTAPMMISAIPQHTGLRIHSRATDVMIIVRVSAPDIYVPSQYRVRFGSDRRRSGAGEMQ
jgi:hypothetical protein